jgi:hypothetical protein
MAIRIVGHVPNSALPVAPALGEGGEGGRSLETAPDFNSSFSVWEFVRTLCVGKEYDSCHEFPCRYASVSGCQHPQHPKGRAVR